MKVLFMAVMSFFLLSLSLQSYSQPEVKSAPQTVNNTALPQRINLNTADAKALSKSIKGIGIKRAESIIKYREEHHGFKSIMELSEVPLLGKNFVNNRLKEIEETFSVN